MEMFVMYLFHFSYDHVADGWIGEKRREKEGKGKEGKGWDGKGWEGIGREGIWARVIRISRPLHSKASRLSKVEVG